NSAKLSITYDLPASSILYEDIKLSNGALEQKKLLALQDLLQVTLNTNVKTRTTRVVIASAIVSKPSQNVADSAAPGCKAPLSITAFTHWNFRSQHVRGGDKLERLENYRTTTNGAMFTESSLSRIETTTPVYASSKIITSEQSMISTTVLTQTTNGLNSTTLSSSAASSTSQITTSTNTYLFKTTVTTGGMIYSSTGPSSNQYTIESTRITARTTDASKTESGLVSSSKLSNNTTFVDLGNTSRSSFFSTFNPTVPAVENKTQSVTTSSHPQENFSSAAISSTNAVLVSNTTRYVSTVTVFSTSKSTTTPVSQMDHLTSTLFSTENGVILSSSLLANQPTSGSHEFRPANFLSRTFDPVRNSDDFSARAESLKGISDQTLIYLINFINN
ncbi:unnamed protein product, partial [Didymodactylos carnosus]